MQICILNVTEYFDTYYLRCKVIKKQEIKRVSKEFNIKRIFHVEKSSRDTSAWIREGTIHENYSKKIFDLKENTQK